MCFYLVEIKTIIIKGNSIFFCGVCVLEYGIIPVFSVVVLEHLGVSVVRNQANIC